MKKLTKTQIKQIMDKNYQEIAVKRLINSVLENRLIYSTLKESIGYSSAVGNMEDYRKEIKPVVKKALVFFRRKGLKARALFDSLSHRDADRYRAKLIVSYTKESK